MALSIDKLNPKYEPHATCDVCRKGYDKGDLLSLYLRTREGVSLIYVHQPCLQKRIEKAAAITHEATE